MDCLLQSPLLQFAIAFSDILDLSDTKVMVMGGDTCLFCCRKF